MLANAQCKQHKTQGLTHIDLTLEYVDLNHKPLDFAQISSDLIIRIPYITGSFFGKTENESVFLLKPDSNRKIYLNLLKKHKLMKKAASKISKKWRDLGLKASPKNTKISRLGTFAYDSSFQSINVLTGIKDPLTNFNLMLVYVNKKSRITGDVILGDEKYIHDISLPFKGFHWLITSRLSAKVFKIERYSNIDKAILELIDSTKGRE
ncbi:MAG TPA: hypothetical protein ENJ41_07570 [Oceanospirillales bacterium]|nr:hypothetical protein [Oceanospirillales bacterium]